MKLLYIINSITNSGGIERIVIDKVNALSSKGIDIVLVYIGSSDDIAFYPIMPKIAKQAINPTHGNYVKRMFHYTEELKHIIKIHKPDVIINANAKILGWTLPFVNRKIPKVVELHFSYEGLQIMNHEIYGNNKIKIYLNNLLRRLIYPLYDKCVVLAKDDLKSWNLKNLILIPNFTNFGGKRTSPLNNNNAICVGRLEYQKNIDLLIDAWRVVHRSFPNWKLNIYGEGTLRGSLQKQIEALNLQDVVTLQGASKNIDDAYCESSLFVLPSRYEGLPLVLIEAMKYGLPAISFDISGVNDVIVDEKNGFLISNAQRTPEYLAEKIMLLISRRDLLNSFSAEASKTYNQFDKEKIISMWIGLFQTLMKKNEKKTFSLILSDLQAWASYAHRKPSFGYWLYLFVKYPEYRVVFKTRLHLAESEIKWGGLIIRVLRVIVSLSCYWHNTFVYTPYDKIGPGLMLHHGFATMISASEIGKNCHIYQQVTIGNGRNGTPIIGDNVRIFPGAKIFGGIKIGDNVQIGANAVVTHNVPANAIVAGVPAKIIRYIQPK